jgi:hypothetical protein
MKPQDANEKRDDVKSAPESGDPLVSGRSHGRAVDDSASDEETERVDDEGEGSAEQPESGRHEATTPSTRPELGTQGV